METSSDSASVFSEPTSLFPDPFSVASLDSSEPCLSPLMNPVPNASETGVETTRKVSKRQRSFSCGQAFPMRKLSSVATQPRCRQRCVSYPSDQFFPMEYSTPLTRTRHLRIRRHSAQSNFASVPSCTNEVPTGSQVTPASVASVHRHQRSSSLCDHESPLYYMKARPTQCRRSSSLKTLKNGLVLAFEETSVRASPNGTIIAIMYRTYNY